MVEIWKVAKIQNKLNFYCFQVRTFLPSKEFLKTFSASTKSKLSFFNFPRMAIPKSLSCAYKNALKYQSYHLFCKKLYHYKNMFFLLIDKNFQLCLVLELKFLNIFEKKWEKFVSFTFDKIALNWFLLIYNKRKMHQNARIHCIHVKSTDLLLFALIARWGFSHFWEEKKL